MIRLPILASCALAATCAAGLHAQNAAAPQCPGGRDDTEGIAISSSLAAHPRRAADIIDSVLVAGGYEIQVAPPGEGAWRIAPRFDFVEGLTETLMEEMEHPGVQLLVSTEARGDSVHVEVAVHTICTTLRLGEPDETAESSVELVHAVMFVSQLEERAEALREAGVDMAAPVERGGKYSLHVPEEVAGFRRTARHDYEDPAAGVMVRYAREDGSTVDIYVYPGAPPACDAACGAEVVNEEVDGFIRGFPELVRRGYFEEMRVTGDEVLPVPPGAAWVFGRHLTLAVQLEGKAEESQYYLFAFPGYNVKVRATFPPAQMTDAVRAFVDALLPLMASDGA